jgi:hypothetical protein
LYLVVTVLLFLGDGQQPLKGSIVMSDEATTTLPKTDENGTPMAPDDHIGTGTPPADPPPVPDPNTK